MPVYFQNEILLYVSELSLCFQGPNAKRKTTVTYTRSQTSISNNKHVLTLLMPYSDLYQLTESPWAELWFPKLTDFFYCSLNILELCLRDWSDWKDETSSSELQLSFACGLKLPTIDNCRQSLYKKSGGLLPVQ